MDDEQPIKRLAEIASDEFAVQVDVFEYRADFRVVGFFGHDGPDASYPVLWGDSEFWSADINDRQIPAEITGFIKRDGCCNWDTGEAMVHDCGIALMVKRAEAMVHAMRIAAREIPGADPEAFGFGGEEP